jgi:3-hydroxyacyl-CoA dehydrogenase/enoyl-CoA hydratase/3-hydroxybutyryl-CoA epimerase
VTGHDSDPEGHGAPAAPVRIRRLEDGVAVVVFDLADSAANKITLEVLEALESLLDRLEGDPPRGVVFISAKDHFCVGADVALLAGLESRQQALEGSRRGQAAFGRIEMLPCPTVAAIHGSCLGGGLEWALACDRIVAAGGPGTRIGAPDVRLGILPAWGGTQRLPRRVGLGPAVEMMAGGRAMGPERARARGVVDRIVPSERLEEEALSEARRLAERRRGGRVPVIRRHGLVGTLSRWLPPVRGLVFSQVRKAVASGAGPHYPAPPAIVEAVRASFGLSPDQGLAVERELFADLALGKISRRLVALFLIHRDSRHWYQDLEKGADVEVARVAVLGAGVMGAGIAHLAAAGGLDVVLRDIAAGPLEAGISRIQEELNREVERRRLDPAGAREIRNRITAVTEAGALAGAGLVIEAVVEEIGLKKQVLSEAAAHAPGAIFASNSSALSIGELSGALPEPGRLAGLHFFNPVAKMPLVEVVAPPTASQRSVGLLLRLARRLGKVPIRVKDSPGFLVNRVLSAYLVEAVAMVEEGASIASLDRRMRGFGLPVGPLELLDQIGLDVAGKVIGTLRAAFPHRAATGRLLDELLAAGRTGRKGNLGFYRWESGRPVPDQEGVAALAGRRAAAGAGTARSRAAGREVAASDVPRLVYPMIAEAVRCLEEEVVGRAEEVDLAMIMGIGWPPFLGGLLRYADDTDLARVVASLERLAARHGDHLSPPPRLAEMARRGERFYAAG